MAVRPPRRSRWQASAAISVSTGRPFQFERTAICGATWSCPLNCANSSQMGAQSSACRGRAATPAMKLSKSAQLHGFREHSTPVRIAASSILQYGDTRAEREALQRDHGVTLEHLPDIDNSNDIDCAGSADFGLRYRGDRQQHDGASRRRARQGNLSACSRRSRAHVVLVPRSRRQSVLSADAVETEKTRTALGRTRRRNRRGDRITTGDAVMLAAQRGHTGSISEPEQKAIDQAIETGVALHRRGLLDDAERLYAGILKLAPQTFRRHASARGHSSAARRQRQGAANSLAPRWSSMTASADAYANHSKVLLQLRRFDEALVSIERALALVAGPSAGS